MFVRELKCLLRETEDAKLLSQSKSNCALHPEVKAANAALTVENPVSTASKLTICKVPGLDKLATYAI